ncbi:MAG: DUF1127 domain-containing protein [Pseudomonadota bacterium]
MIQLISVFRAFLAEVKDRRQLQTLLQKEDRILQDIGLTREDIEMALQKPYNVPARSEARRLARLSFSLDRAI